MAISFFPHVGGASTAYNPLAETTFDSILDSIVLDVGAGQNGWTLYDDQRTLGTTNFIQAYGNYGGVEGPAGGTTALTNWTTGTSAAPNSSNWASAAGNNAGTELYAGRTQIALSSSNNNGWYTVNSTASLIGGLWNFTLTTNFTGSTYSNGPYFVKLQKYIVLRSTGSLNKTYYMLLARPDSACDILRVQAWETWTSGSATGTVAGPMEIMRGTETCDTVNFTSGTGAGSWGGMPVKYMLWLLPSGVFGLWAGLGSCITNAQPRSDFCYAGPLDTTGVTGSDSNAVVFVCSNTQLSGFGAWPQTAYNQTFSQGTLGGNTSAARCLRTLAGEAWSMPISGANSTRPNGWNPNNQYTLWPRGMPYFWATDRAQLDQGGRVQYTEFDLYQVGGNSLGQGVNSWNPSGSAFNEGKRGTLAYLKCPITNPSGLHLVTIGAGPDALNYVMFKVWYPQGTAAPYNTYRQYDIGGLSSVEEKLTGFASSWKITGAAATPLGDLGGTTSAWIMWYRWLLMPINV
jgi:hypothetical protein